VAVGNIDIGAMSQEIIADAVPRLWIVSSESDRNYSLSPSPVPRRDATVSFQLAQ
jgi:hypothetical protein